MDNYKKHEAFRHLIIGLLREFRIVAKVTQEAFTTVQKHQAHWHQYQDLNVEQRLIEEPDNPPNQAEAITTLTINNRILYLEVETMQTFQSSMRKQLRKGCITAMRIIWITEIIQEAYLVNFQIILMLLVVNTLNPLSSRLERSNQVMHHSMDHPSICKRGALREHLHTCKRIAEWQIPKGICQMHHAQLAIGWGSKTKLHSVQISKIKTESRWLHNQIIVCTHVIPRLLHRCIHRMEATNPILTLNLSM